MTTSLQLVERPDTADLSLEASLLVVEAKALTITDDSTFGRAVEFMRGCADLRRSIVAKFADPKKKAFDAHKSLVVWETEELLPVAIAETEAKKKIGAYQTEQERIRRIEEARLRDEARKREEERILAEAQELQDDGDAAGAEELIAAPILPPPVRMAPAVPKVAGVAFRETWSARVTDPLALVRFVAAHPEYLNCVTPNMTALNQIARAQKSAAKIDGVVIQADTNVAAGRR